MKIGDTVTLKHGGAFMTVVSLDEGMATCMWTDTQQMPHEIFVPVEALEIEQLEEDT